MKKDEARRDSTARPAAAGEGETLAAVSALMAERRRFEGWLAALDARRASTPEHVFTRVSADYQARLDAVIEQLTSHTDGLHREMQSLTERLTGLRDDQQRAQDERAEAELRAHVGELSPEAWKITADASDVRLGELRINQAEVEGEIARTRELLEATQRPAATTPDDVPDVSDSAEADMHVPAAAEAAPPAPEPEAAPEPEPAAKAPEPRPSAQHALPMDEPPALPPAPEPVAPAASAPEPEPIAAAPVAPSADQAPRASVPQRKSSFDELAFLSSVVDTPSGSVEPAPLDEPDEVTRRQTFARRSQEDAIVNLADSGSIPLVSKIPDSDRDATLPRATRADQMIRRDSVSDGAKTLKCGECGSMNYPTEWYCERCGAELASL